MDKQRVFRLHGVLRLALAILLGMGVFTVVNDVSPFAVNAEDGNDLSVVATSSQILSSFGYVQVEAVMNSELTRNDGSEGSYNVPLTFSYPLNRNQCNGVGIADIVNSVFYETFEFVGTKDDPLFPTLFPFAQLLLGDDFMFSSQHGGSHRWMIGT